MKYIENSQCVKYKTMGSVIDLLLSLPANDFWSRKQMIAKACKKSSKINVFYV